jgi:chromosomal replication initiator protein
MSPEQAWRAVVDQLRIELPKASFDTWVKNTQFLNYDSGLARFEIGTGNAFARDWLEGRLSQLISNKLSGLMGSKMQVVFRVGTSHVPVEEDCYSEEPQLNQPDPTVPNTSGLVSRYRFENFVVGPSNRLAHAACMAVAENPASAYNPLFLYGGVGLGKTHILHAIGNAVAYTGKQVLYVSSEEFTNDLVSAIRGKTQAAMREKYREVDVLLIDDIQFIAGKTQTQEEFFHTFNALHNQEKQIVMSSDRAPKALSTLEERLRSRFEWGLTVDIQAPDYETRLAILRSKAEKAGRKLPAEVLELIARQVQANIRELEGAWNRVLAFSDLSGQPLDITLAQNALADYLPQKTELSPSEVLATVAKFFGVSQDNMVSKNRTKDIVLPRQVAMYLLREQSGMSLPRIGQVFGGRDHTTVIYACDKVATMIETDDKIRRQVLELREQLSTSA